MVHFNLKSPCGNCPFRKDVRPYLTRKRAKQIVDGMIGEDKTFTCHKTISAPKQEHCAGALIMLEKINLPNQMMRISERLRLYNRKELKYDAPVFDNFGDFILAQS